MQPNKSSRLIAALFVSGFVSVLSLISRADTPPVTDPATRGEIQAMDEFLDTHSVIADELRRHPAQADSPAFLNAHPEYATFVAEHPGVADQLKQHPRYFVHRSMMAQRHQPVTGEELRKLDAFLDSHPAIEKELVAHPGLVDDPKYVEAHPELHSFLNHHPGVDGVLESKPRETMRKEENREEFHGEIKAMDAFLDTHSVIADELRKHPAAADDPAFLKANPDYATFVAEHPEIAEQLKQHPRYFMHRAFHAQKNAPITPAEVVKLDTFLDSHPDIERQLVANPTLIDDPKFIETHPELHKFLNRHPGVDGALESKPRETMKREEHHSSK